MSRFNTGNPLGSNDPRDLDDNAKNMDLAVNAEADTFQDRLGKSRLTWAGIEKAGSGDPGVIVPIVQQAVADVVDAVDGAVDRAEGAADRAEDAKVNAETVLVEVEKAVNLGAANVYVDVASGLAATEDTDNFWVLPNEGDGIENLTLYTNNASVAVKLYELYNLESYMIEEGSNWE